MALDLEGDLATFFSADELAESGTYTPVSGSPVSGVLVIIDRVDEDSGLGIVGSQRAAATMLVRASQLAADPAEGDTWSDGSVTWTVRGWSLDASGLVWQLDVDPA